MNVQRRMNVTEEVQKAVAHSHVCKHTQIVHNRSTTADSLMKNRYVLLCAPYDMCAMILA